MAPNILSALSHDNHEWLPSVLERNREICLAAGLVPGRAYEQDDLGMVMRIETPDREGPETPRPMSNGPLANSKGTQSSGGARFRLQGTVSEQEREAASNGRYLERRLNELNYSSLLGPVGEAGHLTTNNTRLQSKELCDASTR